MIRRQVVVPAPPAQVWKYLTEADSGRSWLGGRLTWSPEEGGELRFEDPDGRIRRGVVMMVRPPRYLRYRWWPEEGHGAPASEVAYLLEPEADATRLTISERRLPAPAGPEVSGPPSARALSTPAGSVAGSAPGWSAGDDRRFRAWAQTHTLVALG